MNDHEMRARLKVWFPALDGPALKEVYVLAGRLTEERILDGQPGNSSLQQLRSIAGIGKPGPEA